MAKKCNGSKHVLGAWDWHMSETKKVLICDPSALFRRTLKWVLKRSQRRVEVTEAESIDQALILLKRKCQDAVFLDIAHPKGNGLDLLSEIKGLMKNGVIIVVSNHDSSEHRKAALKNGADRFLSKARQGDTSLVDVFHTTLKSLW
jgi:DNA-binding NarL/FixJ family response regulator